MHDNNASLTTHKIIMSTRSQLKFNIIESCICIAVNKCGHKHRSDYRCSIATLCLSIICVEYALYKQKSLSDDRKGKGVESIEEFELRALLQLPILNFKGEHTKLSIIQ